MSFTLYRPICHLKWQERILSLNLFNPMQTIIRYKAPNFMNCIKLVHKALSVHKTNSLSPSCPPISHPTPPPSVHSVLLSASHVYVGPARAVPHRPPTHSSLLTLGWNCNHSQRGKLIQSLTLETLTLKTKINSAIESIGHINTSIVPNFIHDI